MCLHIKRDIHSMHIYGSKVFHNTNPHITRQIILLTTYIQEGIKTATQQITVRCLNSKEALIWYHECMVRYSNRCFFSAVEEWPRFNFVDFNVNTNSTEGIYGYWLLSKTLSDAVGEAVHDNKVILKDRGRRK